MEIHAEIEDAFFKNLQNKLQISDRYEVAKVAFGLLSWAVNEYENNRVIFSCDAEGQNLHKLAMVELIKINQKDT